jgi:hypothetical protein
VRRALLTALLLAGACGGAPRVATPTSGPSPLDPLLRDGGRWVLQRELAETYPGSARTLILETDGLGTIAGARVVRLRWSVAGVEASDGRSVDASSRAATELPLPGLLATSAAGIWLLPGGLSDAAVEAALAEPPHWTAPATPRSADRTGRYLAARGDDVICLGAELPEGEFEELCASARRGLVSVTGRWAGESKSFALPDPGECMGAWGQWVDLERLAAGEDGTVRFCLGDDRRKRCFALDPEVGRYERAEAPAAVARREVPAPMLARIGVLFETGDRAIAAAYWVGDRIVAIDKPCAGPCEEGYIVDPAGPKLVAAVAVLAGRLTPVHVRGTLWAFNDGMGEGIAIQDVHTGAVVQRVAFGRALPRLGNEGPYATEMVGLPGGRLAVVVDDEIDGHILIADPVSGAVRRHFRPRRCD